MRTQSTDTPPEIEEILLEGYRRMHPVEKLRQVFDLNRTAQRMAALRIQARYGPTSPNTSCASGSPPCGWIERP
jgi:hypothetical protein